MTKKHFLVALMLSPLFLAGCNNGGGSDPSASEPLSITCLSDSKEDAVIQYSYVKGGDSKRSFPNLQWSLNKTDWKPVVEGTETITTLEKGQTIYFKGDNKEGFNYYVGNETSKSVFKFVSDNSQFDRKFKISGNIMSLVSSKNYADNKNIPCEGCFYGLFPQFGSSKSSSPTGSVVDASELLLPATELKNYAYAEMFGNTNTRSAITKAPKKLPATKAADNCYYNMFFANKFLVTVPEICLETLASGACHHMFEQCNVLEIFANAGKGDTKFFTCPSTEGFDVPVTDMFKDTNGEFKGTPEAGNIYYYNAIK